MSHHQLNQEQRYEISAYLQTGKSYSYIAKAIGVHTSTISREVKRNSDEQGHYYGGLAQKKARKRKSQNPGNRSVDKDLKARVFQLICENFWSPEQVSGYLLREGLKVSKSTIYNWIDACGMRLSKRLRKSLRHKGKKRRSRYRIPSQIEDRISIEQRPEHNDGRFLGDWEMDTIVGPKHKGVIVTLVEKRSRYLLMRWLKHGKKAVPLAQTVVEMLRASRLPVNSITTDNGFEFAAHELIAKELNTTVYFAHPYCSWEKGAIENMNGLIRQFFPKKQDLSYVSPRKIWQVQQIINNRPRKCLEYFSPMDVISQFFS